MNSLMPNTTTVTQLQRSYKKVAQKAKALRVPLIILSNNNPDGVYLDYETFKNMVALLVPKNRESKLANLSGIWSQKEAKDFDLIIDSSFEKID